MTSRRDPAVRAATILLLPTMAFYIPWMLGSIDWSAWWLSVPFVLANIHVTLTLLVSAVNNWSSRESVDVTFDLTADFDPRVAVIIPTAGEDPFLVNRTIESVLQQHWSRDRLWMIVSDDAANPAIHNVVRRNRRPGVRISYHLPPSKGSEERRGDAKAGNLNSALDLISETSDVAWDYIETRDADDLVGDDAFLRTAVAHLEGDPSVAFVQTIKEAHVSPGDPFDNLQPLFYRGAMFARNADNAVFPCGSGLVWRAEALEDIGGFPTWNLVEDLQAGIEALRRGWTGLYVPIVGAVAQHAPEDIPNVYKQRGTWAIDAMRLLFWGDMKGLNLRQRLHFAELGLFYSQSIALTIFMVSAILGLFFGQYPLVASGVEYSAHFLPFALAIEVFLASLATGFRYERIWKARQMWMGLIPVFANACIDAFRYGPDRKPEYRVTRKFAQPGWYWREVLPQAGLLFALSAAVVYRLAVGFGEPGLDVGTIYWAAFFAVPLAGFLSNTGHGVGKQGFEGRPESGQEDVAIDRPRRAASAAVEGSR